MMFNVSSSVSSGETVTTSMLAIDVTGSVGSAPSRIASLRETIPMTHPSSRTGYALWPGRSNNARASATVASAGRVATSRVITSRTWVVRNTSTSYSAWTLRPRRESFSVISDSRINELATISAMTLASMSGKMIW